MGFGRNNYTPQTFILGVDHIPQIKLYGNSKIDFHAPVGQSNPTADALYDPRSKDKQLIQTPPSEQNKVVEMLRKKVINYKKH